MYHYIPRYCAPTRAEILAREAAWNERCDRPTNDALLAGLCAKLIAEQDQPVVLPFYQWLAAKVTRLTLRQTSFARTSVIRQPNEVEPPQPVGVAILIDNWPIPVCQPLKD